MMARIPNGSIGFYKTTGPYGFLSNFYKREIIDSNGVAWPTSEHYFQAQKFAGLDDDYMEEIRNAATPSKAAALGRSRTHKIRDDWDLVRDSEMYDVTCLKYDQHADLREQLLDTVGFDLVEDSMYDDYWGNGKWGDGKNMLGKTLMQRRLELTLLMPRRSAKIELTPLGPEWEKEYGLPAAGCQDIIFPFPHLKTSAQFKGWMRMGL